MAVVATITAFPGPFGNLVTIDVVGNEGGPDLTITVNGNAINLSIGTTGGTPNLDWNDLAVLINVDPATSALVSVSGTGSFALPNGAGTISPLQGGFYGFGAGQFYYGATTPPPAPTPAPSPSPGGPRPSTIVLNSFDACLAREYRLYDQVDRELLSCAKKPQCFLYDERQWGGNYDDAEEIGQGPPTGAIAFNPTGQVPLPAPADGDVVIFTTRVPIGYDGIILGQFHGYYSVPIPGPITSVFVEGSGDIRWRVAVARRFAKDCGDITVTLGTLRTFSTVAGGLQLRSGDTVQYIVNVPNFSGGLAPGVGSILAGLHGWYWPRK